MKPISEVFEDDYYNYDRLLSSMGYEIVLQVDDKDYQGDSRVLYRNGDRYGLLIFGWGSCSGCDALYACGSLEEVDKLRSELHDQIIWKDSRAEIRDFIANRDWEAQYSYHAEETRDFVAKALELLK